MPAIGMGGSRLGSLLARGGPDEAAAAVRAALEVGISLFDTANIYGQGSSELILGRTLPQHDVEICTKAGFVTPAPLWVLRLVKPVLRSIMQGRGSKLRTQFAQQRSQSYPQRFDSAHLGRSLQGSLRRLRRERVDIFLLHNPSPDVACQEGLWGWVDQELARGRIGAFGVSCAGDETDRVWLDHPTVTVVQVPARSVAPKPGGLLQHEDAGRLRIMVRELVGPGQHSTAAIGEALQQVAASRASSTVVLGMSSAKHVREIAALVPLLSNCPASAQVH